MHFVEDVLCMCQSLVLERCKLKVVAVNGWVCMWVPAWARGVCAVRVSVFSFKRRKTTVVTERSRKISSQIAATLVPRGLRRAAASTITDTLPSQHPNQTVSPLKTKPAHNTCATTSRLFYYWHRLKRAERVIIVSELTLATSHKQNTNLAQT